MAQEFGHAWRAEKYSALVVVVEKYFFQHLAEFKSHINNHINGNDFITFTHNQTRCCASNRGRTQKY